MICSDKTGTLTRNEMTVRAHRRPPATFDVTGAGYEPRGAIALAGRDVDAGRRSRCWPSLALAAPLCNDAQLRRRRRRLAGRRRPDGGRAAGAGRSRPGSIPTRARARAAARATRSRSTPRTASWRPCTAATQRRRPSSTSRARRSGCSRCATGSCGLGRRGAARPRVLASRRSTRSRRRASGCWPSRPGRAGRSTTRLDLRRRRGRPRAARPRRA